MENILEVRKEDYDELCDGIRNLITIAEDCNNDMEHRMSVIHDLLKHHRRDRQMIVDRIRSLEKTLNKLRLECQLLTNGKENEE